MCNIYRDLFTEKLCFHSIIISINVYIKSGSTCKEAAMLQQHVSAVVQNVGQLRGC